MRTNSIGGGHGGVCARAAAHEIISNDAQIASRTDAPPQRLEKQPHRAPASRGGEARIWEATPSPRSRERLLAAHGGGGRPREPDALRGKTNPAGSWPNTDPPGAPG